MRALALAGVMLVSELAAFATESARLRFTSPPAGQTIHGQIALSVSAPAGTQRVEYRIGSHLIGLAEAPPFALNWNSAESMDGTIAIQAHAFPSGEAETLVRIANRGAALDVLSPDLGKPLSGIVDIALKGADLAAFPAVWSLNIDGEEQTTVWTDNTWRNPLTVHLKFDTARFSNGSHELQINMNSRAGPANPRWVNWRGMVNRVVAFQNGHAWMDSLPVLRNVYLRPGDQVLLGCRRDYTDATTASCIAPVYRSADASVATIDRDGMIHARAIGFTRVSLADGPKTSEAYVRVALGPAVPHFSGDGQLLSHYNPDRSFLPIAPFFLDADMARKDPQLERELIKSGVNTLSFGLFPNPRNTETTFDTWRKSFDATVGRKIDWARDHGFHLLLTGDDIARRKAEDAAMTLAWPAAREALDYAMKKLAASRVAIGLEVVDESSRLWGPKPPAALRTIRDWLIAPTSHVPIAWPALAADSAMVHGNWMGPHGISDYASHYFTSLKTRTTYPWAEGIEEGIDSMEREFFDRQPHLQLDRPQLMLVSLAGPSYVKRKAASARFTPGTDELDLPGVSPEHISALMMSELALGGAGLRLYFFEPSSDMLKRRDAKPGTSLQTGSNPRDLQPDSWRAMSEAARLITDVLQPYFLGTLCNSPNLGRHVITTIRESSKGKMLLIVNGNDWPRTVRPQLLGGNSVRYRLSATRVDITRIDAAESDTITLEAGESVVYVWEKLPSRIRPSAKRSQQPSEVTRRYS